MSRRVSRSIFLGALSLFLLLGASNVLGQNADKNSAGPTKNDFRLRIVEPIEGATVTGSTVRVTVANGMPRTLQGSSRTNDMPNPSFRVYLGNTLKGELKRDDNVLTIENVPVGSQKLVVEALNPSGEIIDRKEINFQTVASSSPAALSSIPTTEPKPAASSEQKPAASSAATSTTTTNPPPVIEPAPAPAPATSLKAKTLPKTASSAPRAGLAGLALVLAGLLVSRKATR
jgi:hypothetical protein